MGPLVKPDPKSVSGFQVLLAKVASRILPNLQIGGVSPDLVTSDKVSKRYFKEMENINFLEG